MLDTYGDGMMYAVYFAPRGKRRLLALGHLLAQRHLSPLDKLIGVIGDAGAGKSLLIKGMFPGLELANDEDGVNGRPLPLLNSAERGLFNCHTYHLDVRFETGFTQIYTLAEAVRQALDQGKRVIIEHFDLIYPVLRVRGDILIGIGEEVIVTRPNIFGPEPQDIGDIVCKSIKYRKMAHTAEDLTCKVLEEHFGCPHSRVHGDVKHGFVLEFSEKPQVDIKELEDLVKKYIEAEADICYVDENHIQIGTDEKFHCTGPRIHVRNAGEINNFQLVKDYKYDPFSQKWALVGLVGTERAIDINDLNKLGL